MIELTTEQRLLLEQTAKHPDVVETNTTYVLIRKELYDRLQELVADELEQQAVLAFAKKQAAKVAHENPY